MYGQSDAYDLPKYTGLNSQRSTTMRRRIHSQTGIEFQSDHFPTGLLLSAETLIIASIALASPW